MKRRMILAGIALGLAGAMVLSGCEKTPDKVIVTEKGKDNIANYESTENTGTQLRTLLNIPETYTNSVDSQDGIITIDTDATVSVPDVSSMNTIGVSALFLDQDMIDKLTDNLFGDSPVYSAENYYTATKEELQRRVDELKQAAAEGNMDPFGYGPDSDGNEYDIEAAIAELEKSVAEAPEKVELEAVKPQLADVDYGESDVPMDSQDFSGVVDMDGVKYSYQLRNSKKFMVESNIDVSRIREDNGSGQYGMWTTAAYEEEFGTDIDEQTFASQANLTREDAEKKADDIVDKVTDALGIDGLEVSDCTYEAYYNTNEMGDMSGTAQKLGYTFNYVRNLAGVPITYTMCSGGAVEDMDSTTEPWAYETLEVLVTEDGLENLEMHNPYQLGEVANENVKLLDFDSIVKTYEDMMLIANADISEYESSRTFHITRITLGYTRIYDPKADNTSGVLVPAWDFFGGFDYTPKDTQYGAESMSADNSTQSFMTINAVDGTIIDRELGY